MPGKNILGECTNPERPIESNLPITGISLFASFFAEQDTLINPSSPGVGRLGGITDLSCSYGWVRVPLKIFKPFPFLNLWQPDISLLGPDQFYLIDGGCCTKPCIVSSTVVKPFGTAIHNPDAGGCPVPWPSPPDSNAGLLPIGGGSWSYFKESENPPFDEVSGDATIRLISIGISLGNDLNIFDPPEMKAKLALAANLSVCREPATVGLIFGSNWIAPNVPNTWENYQVSCGDVFGTWSYNEETGDGDTIPHRITSLNFTLS